MLNNGWHTLTRNKNSPLDEKPILILLILVVQNMNLFAHPDIPVGKWVDRGGIVAITDEGEGKFSLEVIKKGKGNYTHGNGTVVERPSSNSRRKESETVLDLILRRGKNKFPQIGYFDEAKDTLRFKGGMVWTRYVRSRSDLEIEQLRIQNAQLRLNLQWAERQAQLALAEARRQKVTGRNLTVVSFTDSRGNLGSLSKKENGNWIERDVRGKHCNEFEAFKITADSVFLHNLRSESHMDFRIDLKAACIIVTEDEKQTDTYTITGIGGR